MAVPVAPPRARPNRLALQRKGVVKHALLTPRNPAKSMDYRADQHRIRASINILFSHPTRRRTQNLTKGARGLRWLVRPSRPLARFPGPRDGRSAASCEHRNDRAGGRRPEPARRSSPRGWHGSGGGREGERPRCRLNACTIPTFARTPSDTGRCRRPSSIPPKRWPSLTPC